jgi:hypothetical protein
VRSPEVARLFHPPAFGVVAVTAEWTDTGGDATRC